MLLKIMARDPPSRRPYATPEGPNPQDQNPSAAANPGIIAGGSNTPGELIPRRHGKDPVLPNNPANQGFAEERGNQGYSERVYHPTEAELEVIRLNRILAERDRQLAEATKKRAAGRPRKETSRRRNETEVTETETIHTKVQTRTGSVTRQAARTVGETRGTGAQAP